MIPISVVVEGDLDEAVLRSVAQHIDVPVGRVHGKRGRDAIEQRIASYQRAARAMRSPWMVLIDLDRDECAPRIRRSLLPEPSEFLELRVAVREVESWLLADRERIARFLRVSADLIPLQPEALDDPKRFLGTLAGRSSARDIRLDVAPREGGGREVGPAYGSRMAEFVQDTRSGWRPAVAARSSDSLRRCLAALTRLRERA
ncbi:MAG: hypothetical protein IPK67_12470 [Planctomycetes bacterium]|nr:hypothetical protein [Planctomycetota bacterium]